MYILRFLCRRGLTITKFNIQSKSYRNIKLRVSLSEPDILLLKNMLEGRAVSRPEVKMSKIVINAIDKGLEVK